MIYKPNQMEGKNNILFNDSNPKNKSPQIALYSENSIFSIFYCFCTRIFAIGRDHRKLTQIWFQSWNNSGKQCNPGRIAKSLLVGSAPKPLKTRACALWLCRIPASFDLQPAPEIKKREAPVPFMLLRTASDTGALLSFWFLFPLEIFLFWQIVAFQKIKIILNVV